MSTIQKIGVGVLLIFAFATGIYLSNQLRYDFITLNGDTHSHDDLLGQTIVVNYFAEWCAPCLREIPELNEFHHQLPENVKLFAVSFDALSQDKLSQVKKKYGIEFPLIASVKNDFIFEKPDYLPATFIIKPNGELAGQLLGEQTVRALNEAVSAY